MMVGSMMGFGGFGMLIWFLVIAAIIGLLVYGVFRYTQRSTGVARHGRSDDVLRILNERYARGEIDSETYQRIKNDLK